MRTAILVFYGILIYAQAWGDEYQAVVAGSQWHIYQKHDAQIKQAVLFYRREGSRQYLQQPMTKQAGQWVAELSGSQLQQPGVEYYTQLALQDGSSITDPQRYPEYNPKHLTVKPAASAGISIESNPAIPAQGSIAIRVTGIGNGLARIFIDDTDVTDFVEREDDLWILDNSSGLFSGQSVLVITTEDGQTLAQQKIDFDQARQNNANASQPGDGELVLRGNASFNIGGQTDNTSSGSIALSGNLHMETEYNNGDYRSHFSGINVNYQHGADPALNLSSGFLFDNSYRNHQLQFGDVSISGAPLVLSGFARRGLLYKTKHSDGSATVFNVRTSPVQGWESGLSFDDRQTYGLTWQQNIGRQNQSDIQLSVVSGRLQQPATDNVGSTQTNPQAGDTAGIQFDTELAGTRITAQLATSKFDPDTRDGQNPQTDTAYELKLQRNLYGLNTSIGFHRYGANYATIANPNFSNDRQGLDLSIGSQIQFLGWSGSFSSIRDNIDKDVTRPVVTSNNSSLSLNFVIQNWPSINIGFNLSQQTSSREPTLSQRIDNDGRDILIGLSDTIGAFNLAWSTSVGRLRDRLDPTLDSDTSNHMLSVAYNHNNISINTNLSRNTSRALATKVSELANLSASLPMFSGKLNLNSQLSYQRNTASDNSQDDIILGGSTRLSWRLQDIFSSLSSSWSNAQFSINWTYNRNQDALNPVNDTTEQRIMFEFSLGVPLNFEKRWQL